MRQHEPGGRCGVLGVIEKLSSSLRSSADERRERRSPPRRPSEGSLSSLSDFSSIEKSSASLVARSRTADWLLVSMLWLGSATAWKCAFGRMLFDCALLFWRGSFTVKRLIRLAGEGEGLELPRFRLLLLAGPAIGFVPVPVSTTRLRKTCGSISGLHPALLDGALPSHLPRGMF